MLTKNSFLVLKACMDAKEKLTQQRIADLAGLSVGLVNTTCKELFERNLLTKSYELTDEAYRELEPHKVDNAIIMAAGFSSRFAPISYDRPKGILKVRGEVLIERQIKQLREAGIEDITVVVGYKKEAFFYLADAFDVDIVVNEEYHLRNNNSTLMLVKDKLRNTYICSSDNYFTENVFSRYEYQAYHSCCYYEDYTEEYVVKTGAGGRIIEIDSGGGAQAYGMMGHAYFDEQFSTAFVQFLVEDYHKPETAGKLWDDILVDHLKDLNIVMRPYPKTVVYEFDSLEDLRSFDEDFLLNVDSKILDNICEYFQCTRHDLGDIKPIKEGLTNLSFLFSYKGELYVYRHPGTGTEKIISRESEAYSQAVAKRLGIDDTFVYEDPQTGWKISRYLTDCEEFDYHNTEHVRIALGLIRKLHECGETSAWHFDLYDKACEICELLAMDAAVAFSDFAELQMMAEKLNDHLKQDNPKVCLCHNDFYAPNLLVKDGKISVIDWEYSAMSYDVADIGSFVCSSYYTYDEFVAVLPHYYGRTPSAVELRTCCAATALSGYYWFVWALYKEATGHPVGEWMYEWYRVCKLFGKKALELYAEQQQ